MNLFNQDTPPESMTDLETEILAGISGLKAEHPHDWAQRYFNNFYMHFPTNGDSGAYQEIVKGMHLENEAYSDPYLSPKKRSQTRATFYKTIDATVQELLRRKLLIPAAPRLSAKILSEFRTLSFTGFQELGLYPDKEIHRETLHTMFCELYLPVYISLRKQGYSHTDLTA